MTATETSTLFLAIADSINKAGRSCQNTMEHFALMVNGYYGHTVTELAAETDHSERTIRRWISDYNIAPMQRESRPKRYNLSEVLRAERDTHESQISSRIGKLTTV